MKRTPLAYMSDSSRVPASYYISLAGIINYFLSRPNSKLIGCVGDITFQILGDVDPATIQQINTLADFALYAGVGRKTPMGMGMVRRRQSRDLQSRVQSLGVDPEQPTLAELSELVREYRKEHQ